MNPAKHPWFVNGDLRSTSTLVTNHWGIFHLKIRSTPSTPPLFITLHGLPKRSHRTAVDAWFAEDLETWVVETLFWGIQHDHQRTPGLQANVVCSWSFRLHQQLSWSSPPAYLEWISNFLGYLVEVNLKHPWTTIATHLQHGFTMAIYLQLGSPRSPIHLTT